MGPLDKYILKEDALTATATGIALKFQSHWYRTLPLSCIDFNLKINGETIDDDKTEIEINGKRFPKNEMLQYKDEWLFILDRATIHTPLEKFLKKGQSYDIEFRLDLYIPYILVGPEAKPLLAGTMAHKNLICQ